MPPRYKLLLMFILFILLTACGTAEPTTTPIPPTSISNPTPTNQVSLLTATVTPSVAPLLDGRNGVIAFTSEQDGNMEVYVMRLDGSDPYRLTNHPGEDYWPTWSPDGEQIAFASNRDGDFEIYAVAADGSNLRRLTRESGNDLEPAWSPDGAKITFMVHHNGKSEIYLMNSDGSERQRLTESDGDNYLPKWSPDGEQIVFVSERDGNPEIYVMNADGSGQRRLTDNPSDDLYPSWSQDGAQITFYSDRDGNRELYVMDVDVRNPHPLTHDNAFVWVSDWSPDGSQIAFTSNRDGNREIYIMDSIGNNLLRLTNNNVLDGTPAWRPERERISLQVPQGSAATIDGTFSPGEWDGSLMIDLANGGELMLMHDDGYLYLGIRSRAMGFGSICTVEDDRISILHSSAGLGTAIFEQDGEDWRRTQQFSYCCWEAAQSTLDEFLLREGWVASVGTKGVPEEMEYQIAMNNGFLTLAVVYVDDFSFETALHWPEDLVDDCQGLALIPEDPPERLSFSPETWVTIIASTE